LGKLISLMALPRKVLECVCPLLDIEGSKEDGLDDLHRSFTTSISVV